MDERKAARVSPRQNSGRVSALVVVQTTVAKLDVTSNQSPWRLEVPQPTDSCRMRVKHTRLQETGGFESLRIRLGEKRPTTQKTMGLRWPIALAVMLWMLSSSVSTAASFFPQQHLSCLHLRSHVSVHMRHLWVHTIYNYSTLHTR
jgi:hypothetical protein